MEKSRIKELPIYQNMDGEFLTKKDIVKNFPSNFGISEEGEFEYATTSGTTSDRMQIIRRKNWWQDEYKRTYANNEKLDRYAKEGLRKVIFTTAQCSNLVCFLEKPPMEERIINNTLYVNNTFNPWDWREENIREIISEINYFKPYYLDADPIYLAVFLYLKERYGIKEDVHVPEIITLSYEFVPDNVRRYIENYFRTDIRNLYGTTEFGYAFIENENNKMQICKDLMEISLYPVSEKNNLYTLIVSSMKNEYMPLLNYRVGDMVIATEEEKNNFEKQGIVSKMAGREKDLLFGEISFSMLDAVVSGTVGRILLYQFYFLSDDLCYFKYITIDGKVLSEEEGEALRNKLSMLNFTSKIVFDMVSDIVPESSGKFAIVKKTIM